MSINGPQEPCLIKGKVGTGQELGKEVTSYLCLFKMPL